MFPFRPEADLFDKVKLVGPKRTYRSSHRKPLSPQQGRADRFWNTRNPLQGVLLIHTHLVPGSYLAGLPVGLQDRVLGAGARAARALGLPDTIEPERTRAPA